MIKADDGLDKKILRIFRKAIKAARKKVSISQIEEYKHQVSSETFYQLIEMVDSRRNANDPFIAVFEQMKDELKEALATVGATCLKIPTQTIPLYLCPRLDYLPSKDGDVEKNKYFHEISPDQVTGLERINIVYTPSDRISKQLVTIMRQRNPLPAKFIICKWCGKKVEATRSTKKYCTFACSQAAKRERDKGNNN